MKTLARRVLEFIAELRAESVRISVAESIDAMNAVAAAGFERAAMREALAAAIIKDESDRARFDAAFARFFAGESNRQGSPRRSLGGESLGGGSSHDEPHGVVAPRRAIAPESGVERVRREAREEGAQGERSLRAGRAAGEATHRATRAAGGETAARRALERIPFAGYTELDYEAAREALAPLKRRFKVRLGRRLRAARRGRLDFRRTLRAAIQRGGAPLDLRFRARRPRHIDLVILADVSGSVRYCSELMLEIAAGARELFRNVHSLVFVDRMAEAGFESGHLAMTPALDLYARSDFGRVLAQLWTERARYFGRATVMVIMGDGRNNRRPPRADLLGEIARLCRAVIWLCPEPRDRWGTGDSAIELYRKKVSALLAAGTLAELERGLLHVA